MRDLNPATITDTLSWYKILTLDGFNLVRAKQNLHMSTVSAGMSYRTRPDEDDGFGQIIPLCREYTLSRVNPQSRVYVAIPGGGVIGPVIEVHIVKILDSFGLEISIPSINDPRRTSGIQRKESIRGRVSYSQCRTQTKRGITF